MSPQCDREADALFERQLSAAGLGKTANEILNTSALRQDVRAMQKELDLRQNTINLLMKAVEGVLQEPTMPQFRRRLMWAFRKAQERQRRVRL